MDPFNQARAQNNDLTDADRLALSLGMTRASKDCLSLAATPQSFANNPDQHLSLGRLCLFGQQFEAARAALVDYLALPSPPQRENALILLSRAFIGLNNPDTAGVQVLSLLRDYPYDAQIHLAGDLTIAASEGWNSSGDNQLNVLPTELCEKQKSATIPLLLEGKSLTGKEGDLPAAVLYADALRCFSFEESLGNPTAADTLQQLMTVLKVPALQNTADLLSMQEALSRVQMVGRATPLASLHAHTLNANGTLAARTIALRHGAILLAPFTLWSPSASGRIRALAMGPAPMRFYAITSWKANTGNEDSASPRMIAALRTWQQSLPKGVLLLIVPDEELHAFHVDQFPDAITILDGIVTSNAALQDDGAVRMTLLAAQPKAARQ